MGESFCQWKSCKLLLFCYLLLPSPFFYHYFCRDSRSNLLLFLNQAVGYLVWFWFEFLLFQDTVSLSFTPRICFVLPLFAGLCPFSETYLRRTLVFLRPHIPSVLVVLSLVTSALWVLPAFSTPLFTLFFTVCCFLLPFWRATRIVKTVACHFRKYTWFSFMV